MKIETVFVKKNDLATIKCPECGLIKNFPVTKYRNNRKPLKIRCNCTHVFAVLLDFRQHFRKSVALTGTYHLKPPATGAGLMKVKNISRSGVGYSVSGIHEIQAGQKARLEFTLSNPKQTKLVKKVEIVAVTGNFIGCNFLDDQPFEKDLGFFLRS